MRALATGSPDLEPLSITRLSANPIYNVQLRTTPVVTQIDGGHVLNALPQTARATVNCRLLPGQSVEDVEVTLNRVLADDQISIARFGVPESTLGVARGDHGGDRKPHW